MERGYLLPSRLQNKLHCHGGVRGFKGTFQISESAMSSEVICTSGLELDKEKTNNLLEQMFKPGHVQKDGVL